MILVLPCQNIYYKYDDWIPLHYAVHSVHIVHGLPRKSLIIILRLLFSPPQPALFKQHGTRNYQGGSMPNTSSSVPFLFSSSMQSIRSRRPSCVMGSPFNSGSGLLQQLGSGMVRLTSGYGGGGSGAASPIQQSAFIGNQSNRSSLTNVNRVRKCPSLNITFTS